MTNTGPSIGRQFLEKEVLGDRGSRNSSWNSFLPLIGVVLGVGLTLISTFWVRSCGLRARRASVSQAILQRVKQCAGMAEKLKKGIDTGLLPDYAPGGTPCRHFLMRIDTTFWHAILQDPKQLPPDRLPALVAFYGCVERVNFACDAIDQEQMRLEQLGQLGILKTSEGLNTGRSIANGIVRTAQQAARMCSSLVEMKDIQDLRDLPRDYPWFQEAPADATGSGSPPMAPE